MHRATLTLMLLSTLLAGCLGGQEPAPDRITPDANHSEEAPSSAPEPGPEAGGQAEPRPGDPAKEEATVPDDWPERALPSGVDHDHGDPAQHQDRSTPNMQVLGWDPLAPGGEHVGSHACGGIGASQGQVLSVVAGYGWEGQGSPTAFSVVDATDAEQPALVGTLELPNTMVLDATITPDASHVVVAVAPSDRGWVNRAYEAVTDPGVPTASTTVQATWHDACGSPSQGPETQLTYPQGLLLVDLSDPSAPQIVDAQPLPVYGPHSVHVTEIEGTTYVLSSVTHLVYEATYFTVHTVETIDGAARLAPYAVIDPEDPGFQEDDGGEGDLFPFGDLPANLHVDGALQAHPVTGDVVAYLANWDMGVEIVRLDGPGEVTRLSRWAPEGSMDGELWEGNVHTVLPMATTRDGTHYTFVSQEVITQPDTRPTGEIYMLDTTDPTDPQPVATWTLPVEVGWDDTLIFSPHYMTLSGDTLFVALYHGGVWAVGTRPVDAGPRLPTLGVLLPDNGTHLPAPTNQSEFPWAPVVQDVVTLPSGDVLLYDGHSGAYTVRYDGTVPVPVPTPWQPAP